MTDYMAPTLLTPLRMLFVMLGFCQSLCALLKRNATTDLILLGSWNGGRGTRWSCIELYRIIYRGAIHTSAQTNKIIKLYYLKIVSEISPNIFEVSGGSQTVQVYVLRLEPPPAGIVLLVEFDGSFGGFLIWYWRYYLRRESFPMVHIEGDGPDRIAGNSFTINTISSKITLFTPFRNLYP